jgi:2-polyprenyl-6-methoxyphenol hydroxylase-like FAD-dependent oxidoreductase
VVGCDGIKSFVRRVVVGEDHPAANPVYTHKYAYRGLVPMQKAVEAVGEELASNSCMHVCLPYPFCCCFPAGGPVVLVDSDDACPEIKIDGSRRPYLDLPRQPRQNAQHRRLPHLARRLGRVSPSDPVRDARRRTPRFRRLRTQRHKLVTAHPARAECRMFHLPPAQPSHQHY